MGCRLCIFTATLWPHGVASAATSGAESFTVARLRVKAVLFGEPLNPKPFTGLLH